MWEFSAKSSFCCYCTMRESLRHKSNTFHAIRALCTCSYRLHLWQPISTKRKIDQKVVGSKFMFKMFTGKRRIPPVSQAICCLSNTVVSLRSVTLSSWLCTRSATASMLSSAWHAVRGLPLPDYHAIESDWSIFFIRWSDKPWRFPFLFENNSRINLRKL